MSWEEQLKERLAPALLCTLVLILGLSVRAFLSGWLAKYLGVALWATLVYTLLLCFKASLRPNRAFVTCLVISVSVELFQLTSIPGELAERHFLFALVLGTTFNAPDFAAYAVGAGLGLVLHLRLLNKV